MVKFSSAASISPPSIPQFTLTYNKVSYNLTDPYTGVSQQVDNSTIDIIVKNQPFNTIYHAKRNMTTSLYYNVQVKGHYSENWTDAFASKDYGWRVNDYALTWFDYPIQSDSDYTTIQLTANYPANSQIDVHVQAVIANQTEAIIPDSVPSRGNDYHVLALFIIKASDWTNTQTINLANGSVSVSTSVNPTIAMSPNPSTPTSLSQTPTATPKTNIQPSNTQLSDLFGLNSTQIIVSLIVITVIIALVFALVLSRIRSAKQSHNTA